MAFYNLSNTSIKFHPVDISRGMSYWPGYIEFDGREFKDDIVIHRYNVESESGPNQYQVELIVKNGEIIKGICTCPRYNEGHNCKHIAAVIFRKGEEIIQKSKTREQITNNILNLFCNDKNKNNIKKELKITISLNFENTYKGLVIFPNIKIGDTRLYSLNNKVRKFFDVYDGIDKELNFGKELTYSKDNY